MLLFIAFKNGFRTRTSDKWKHFSWPYFATSANHLWWSWLSGRPFISYLSISSAHPRPTSTKRIPLFRFRKKWFRSFVFVLYSLLPIIYQFHAVITWLIVILNVTLARLSHTKLYPLCGHRNQMNARERPFHYLAADLPIYRSCGWWKWARGPLPPAHIFAIR